jgi:PAS domain S-box-containing protein
MSKKDDYSRTVRIDLIPQVPKHASGPHRENVVVSSSAGSASARDSTKTIPASHFHRLLQALYDAVIVSDLDGMIVDVNMRAEDFLHYSKSEVAGMSVLDIISGADTSLLETVSQNLESERFTLIQAYCMREDGSYFPAEIAVSRIDLEAPRLCFFVRDITVRRQAQEMLITEHNAIQNSSTGIVITDTDAVIEFANPATEKMWRCENETQLLEVKISTLLANPDAISSIIDTLSGNDSQAWSGELVGKRLDDSLFDIEVAAVPNRNSDGDVIGYVFSLADIGDRNRARQAEQESERGRVMLESLGAACHHVSQPATILMGNLEILKDRLESADDEIQNLLQGSLDAMERIDNVLQRLKSASEYKTRTYLERSEDSDSGEDRILDI